MRPDDLLDWTKAVPFRPFRIVLNSGRSYEIRHPEMVKVGRTTVHIYQYIRFDEESAEPLDPYDKMNMVGLALIERIEPISSTHAA